MSQHACAIVDAINTPRPFDWLALGITVLAVLVPVAITIWIWRIDRRALISANDRSRRGEIQRRYGDMVSEILEAIRFDHMDTIKVRKHRLMAAILSIAEPSDNDAVRWIQASTNAMISSLGVKALFTAPSGKRDITEPDDIAIRAMVPIHQWALDAASVDFDALFSSDEWKELLEA